MFFISSKNCRILVVLDQCHWFVAVDGGWTPWSDWGSCGVTCGYGQKSRFRSCSNPSPEYGGLDCPGDNIELMNCFGGNCSGTKACIIFLNLYFVFLFLFFFCPGEHKLRGIRPLNIRTYFKTTITFTIIFPKLVLNIVDQYIRIKHQLLICKSWVQNV